jgi:LmbE family N-acetylglucosaminyl deacetylase
MTKALLITVFAALAVSTPAHATSVFLVPHQDDEVISMGAAIAQAALEGETIIVVRVTGGCPYRWRPMRVFHLTRKGCRAARTREMRASLKRLVPEPGLLTFVGWGYPAGKITDDVARAVIARAAGLWPDATMWTTSRFDGHADHSALGRALADANIGGRQAVQPASWLPDTVAQGQWVEADEVVSLRVRKAALAYKYKSRRGHRRTWRYGIGWRSVGQTHLAYTMVDQRGLWVPQEAR